MADSRPENPRSYDKGPILGSAQDGFDRPYMQAETDRMRAEPNARPSAPDVPADDPGLKNPNGEWAVPAPRPVQPHGRSPRPREPEGQQGGYPPTDRAGR